MSRPVIGITSYVVRAAWGVWHVPTTLIPHVYVESVARSGGQPVVIPPVGVDVSVLDRLDGLVLSGGPDIHPALYGCDPEPQTQPGPLRDAAEMALLNAAVDTDLPVLAVCRGLQLLAVAYG